MTDPGSNSASRHSERRQATVMFADIAGFTAMSEKTDPEEVTIVMNDCFALLGEVVAEHGGTIDKFIGDCIMSLFGVPNAIERAPQRAIEAALTMRHRLAEFNRERALPVPLALHIGINSGEVVAGNIGTHDKSQFTVMGDAVNVASRLEDASDVGQILVGPATFRYAREDFRFKPLKPVVVKGKAEQIQVHEVVASLDSASRPETGGNRAIKSELIGRATETAVLKNYIRDLYSGKGAIVNVIGEAGVGKSRLCAETFDALTKESVTFLEGRALSTGRSLSFYPIIAIVKGWIAATDEDDEHSTFTKLDAAVRTVTPEHTDEIVPFIATMMGLTLDGAYAQRLANVSGDSLATLIAHKLRELLIAACAFRPLIFVIEDVHWSDDSSLDMLQRIVPVAGEAPMLFVFTFRPGFRDSSQRFHAEICQQHADLCDDIELAALKPEQTVELTENLLRMSGIPQRLTEQIVHRSGGNPFFVEEVVRSLVDRGYLQPGEQGFVVSGDLSSISIPYTINEVVMARIDLLDEEKRDLLRVASVIGRSFFYRVLSGIVGSKVPIDGSLSALIEQQLIRRRVRLSEVEYLFKHALAQEAVYNSILVKERKVLHLATARAIKQTFPDRLNEFAGVLAMHFMQGDDEEEAEHYLAQAGEVALKSAASAEAITYFSEAVRVFRAKHINDVDPKALAVLEYKLGLAYQRKGEDVLAIEHFDLALESLEENRKGFGELVDAAWGIVALLRWVYFPKKNRRLHPDVRQGHVREILYSRAWAFSLVDSTRWTLTSLRAIRRAVRIPIDEAQAGVVLLNDITLVPAILGTWGATAERIHRRLREYTDTEYLKYLYENSGLWLFFSFGIGSGEFRPEVLEYFLSVGDMVHANFYADFSCIILANRGRYQGGKQVAMRLKQIATEYQNPGSLVFHHEGMTLAEFGQGNYEAAIEHAEQLIDTSRALDQSGVRNLYLSYLLRALLKTGDLDRAGKIIREISNSDEAAVKMPVQAAPSSIAVVAWYCAVTDTRHAGRMPRALRRESWPYVRMMRRYGKRYAQRDAESCRFLGIWLFQNGRFRAAKRWWQRGITRAEALQFSPEIDRIREEIAFREGE